MIPALLIVLVLATVFVPSLWVRHVMHRHGAEIPGMPGTGGELAEHLVEKLGLGGVRVEVTDRGDHYNPSERVVRLSPGHYGGKSLTAVAVAAHEVGHAIQHHERDPRLTLRTRLVPIVTRVGQASALALAAAPVIGMLTRHPVPLSLLVALGLSGLLGRVVLHLVTLPTEWDASFGRALPILRQGQYIAPGEERAVARVLRAAAFTYVAAALADVLNLARWGALILRR